MTNDLLSTIKIWIELAGAIILAITCLIILLKIIFKKLDKNKNGKIEAEEIIEESDKSTIKHDADVAIIVGRQSDLIVAKKVSATLERLKISYNMKVVCPIRSNGKFKS